MKKFIVLTVIIVFLFTGYTAASTAFYRVQPGDSLWQIACRLKVQVQDLVQWNEIINSNEIYPGQILKVFSVTDEHPSVSWQYYLVKSGDTPWSISLDQEIPLDKILQLNQIDEYIYPGQILKLPAPKTEIWQIHRVKAGETLWEISRKTGMPLEDLMRVNNVSELIYPGQDLKISYIGAPQWQLYEVKPGDSLWLIGRKHGISAEKLQALNNISDPLSLLPGLQILVPFTGQVLHLPQTDTSSGIRVNHPSPTESVGDSMIIKGQANVFEGNVLYRIADDKGNILTKGHTTAGMGDWYNFEVKVNVPAAIPEGALFYLELYTESPKSGSIEELTSIPLFRE